MNNLTFTLIKETIIDIDMEKFIERVIPIYNYYGKKKTKCKTWFIEICIIIDEMTSLDTWEYDNIYEVVRQILINAIMVSRAKSDNNSVEILQKVLQTIDRNG